MKTAGLLVAFLIALTPIQAIACSCVSVPASPIDQINNNDVVFLGMPVGTSIAIEFEDGIQIFQSTKFRVVSSLKGVEGDPDWNDLAYVYVRHNKHAQGNCGVTFYEGLTYQVFATNYKNKNYTSKCHFPDLDEPPPQWSWQEFRKAAGKE